MMREVLKTGGKVELGVEKRQDGGALRVEFRLQGEGRHLLHWGVADAEGGAWRRAPAALWPEGSQAHGDAAVQSPFHAGPEGNHLLIRFPDDHTPPFLVFDLFCPDTHHWENNRGRDFWIPLAPPTPSPSATLRTQVADAAVELKTFALDPGHELAVATERTEEKIILTLVTDLSGPVLLHWGSQDRGRSPWELPAPEQRPENTVAFDARTVRTPFEARDRLHWLELEFASHDAPGGIGCVLFQPESQRWWKHRGADLFLPVAPRACGDAALPALAERIVEGEMGPHGWTLMHRFNLCHELIEDAGEDREAWALLFVWLRYSAMRQLDWQRNYNTKPRELAHAQDRLTGRLAASFIRQPAHRDLIRLMLGCMGRGGEGQRIRDDILHIMHRHHIKEVGGTWMEQWHQKLHNNTTPDDIVICEAYLAFLRANGSLEAYDQALQAGGVTRERLAGFERPITRDPEWHPHLKDGLIHDFEHYLVLLRSVHSGTDLDTAVRAAIHLLEGEARQALEFVRHHFSEEHQPATRLASRITQARSALNALLTREQDPGRVKDGLYLDLALEEALRTVIERQLQTRFAPETLHELIGLVLANLQDGGEELGQCLREWQRLPAENRFTPDWCLRAKAVTERLGRAVEQSTDATYQLLQPKAELLGREFHADEWTIKLFSEEVVRGRPVFVLSMLLHQFDRVLRQGAKLGDWQVLSPSQAAGVVRVVDELRAVQGRVFEQPTVIVADRVQGDEEPPEGVRAVLTSRSVDLVSHVAVRARNARLLFAACFDAATFAQLKRLEGQWVELEVTSAGDVRFAATGEASAPQAVRERAVLGDIPKPTGILRVLRRDQFERGAVGGKAWRIRVLAERVGHAGRVSPRMAAPAHEAATGQGEREQGSPAVGTPRSVALPFGVFDAVLKHPVNQRVDRQLAAVLGQLGDAPESKLAQLRSLVMELEAPEGLMEDLRKAMGAEGLPWPSDGSLAFTRIKQVWASLWNDRAWFSRQNTGFPHDRASMAVLIQEVVPAEYAFVIHTVNPATGSKDELYAEVVRGLGETLVGNHPGRALGFTAGKSSLEPTLLAYPSKSLGLFGAGLIFRSDSNAEDLEGYAGAGLYDSVLLEPARVERLDYTRDPLVWDAGFQRELLRGIAELGVAVEKSFDAPQDIEGAWAQGRFYIVQTRPQV